MLKKLEPRNTGKGSSPRKKTTAAPKRKGCSKEKDIIFQATCIIEGAHQVTVKLGREVEELQFKNTYEKLKKLYKELD
ncbi:MAG TPA: hypothetical protein DCM40_09525 [Maribacter sp.]|nr:hypothetical protein [Maribacter sp.]